MYIKGRYDISRVNHESYSSSSSVVFVDLNISDSETL